jgi:hypothetical protein
VFPGPTKRTTPAEYAVILFLIGLALVVTGIMSLVKGANLPNSQSEAAAQLVQRGGCFLGLGIFVFFALWLVRRIRRGD